MQIGVIGLGRMGANLVRRLTKDGHECIVFDVKSAAVKAMAGQRHQGPALDRQSRRQTDQASGGLDDDAGRGPNQADPLIAIVGGWREPVLDATAAKEAPL